MITPLAQQTAALSFSRLGADLLLSTSCTQEVETLLEELLEFGARAALEQHVPVATGNLRLDLFGLDCYAVAIEEDALLAALRGLPYARNFSVCGEDHFEGLTISRAIGASLSRGELDANFAL
jgi:hypothetical protein